MVTETMGLVIEKPNIERAHRIGRFQSNKNRPVLKFCRSKDKETIFAQGHKLKSTLFAVREDFSAPIRLARGKLLAFAKQQESPYKLRYDKLLLGGCCYIYDTSSDTVIQSIR